ncbi:hypothetical protein [Brevibacillus brevis]|uniref:hypothetical protein n=1 Tax=Brevibacillus brevis TaxID=1393 RepID=UPI0015C61CD3|nr:hypothetical protein [Brevibacillus brevis]
MKIFGYFITFILNLIVAYFIYDQSSYVKPLLQSIFIVALIVIMDFITNKKSNQVKHK